MSLRNLLFFLALLLCTCVSAQTVPDKAKDRASKRAEQKTNNKIDQKVDKAVDDTFSAIEGLFKKKKKNKKGETNPEETVEDGGLVPNNGEEYADDDEVSNALSNLFGGGNFEPYTNDVNFSMVMHIKEIKRNGKTQETTMELAMGPTQIAQKVELADKGEKGTSWSIFNTQTGKVTLVSTSKGETTAMRMRSPNLSNLMPETEVENYMDGITYENTGETRVIEGYSTVKYIVNNANDGSVTESWITEEITLDQGALAQAMTSFMGGGQQMEMPKPPVAGFPIYTISTDKKGVRHEMTYKNVKVGEAAMDKSLFDLGGIPVQEF